MTTSQIPRPTGRALLAVIVALILFATACGDSGITALDEPEADADGDDVDDSDAAPDPGDDADDADVAPDAGDEDDVSPADPGDLSIYCRLAQEQQDRGDAFDFSITAPEETEAYFSETVAAIDEALRIAPQEVRPHLEALKTGFEKLVDILAANGWDFLGSIDELAEIFDNPNFDAAGTALDDYDETACGIVDDDDDDDVAEEVDPFDSPELFASLLETELGRQMFADGFSEDGSVTFDQALCLAETIDIGALVAMTFDPGDPSAEILNSFFDALDACGIEASQLTG